MTDPITTTGEKAPPTGQREEIVEALRAAMTKTEAKFQPPEDGDAPLDEATAPGPAENTEEAETASSDSPPGADPPRDEKGRFAKPEDAPPGDTATQDQPSAEESGKTDDAATQELGPLEPPAHWPVEEQQLFRKQPKEVQEWALARDRHLASEYGKKTQELAEQRRQYESLEQVLKPREQAIKLMGMQPAQYVDHLLALSDYASRDPAGFIRWIAKERDIDLTEIVADQYAGGETLQADSGEELHPQVKTLMDEVNSLKGQLQEYTSADQQARMGQGQQLVDQFRAATDEAGQPKYPYFEEVRELMGTFLETGRAPDIETAYDMAVHATPTTRAKLEAAREAAAARKRQEEARKKAAAAERAGSSITGTPAGSGERRPAATVREEVERHFYGRA